MQVMKLTEITKLKAVKGVVEANAILTETELRLLKDTLEESGNTEVGYFDIKLALAMIQKGDL